MSQYNSLKATIDANVKQNGVQAITGNILNSVLNAMVNTLGTGYQFAGVATTATDPGSPDAKVFYIANGKGTYTNFGGIEVTEDDVVVLYYDTAWHKVATGIASQEKLSELKLQLDVRERSEAPIFVLKHLGQDGGLGDNDNKNAVFEEPVKALRGSYFYADNGYKFQYALYDINTKAFVSRIIWQTGKTIVLDNDYYIRIEISNIPEIPMTDTSISQHLHYVLYSDNAVINQLVLTNKENITAIQDAVNTLYLQTFDLSTQTKLNGVLVAGKWNLVVGKHFLIPVNANRNYTITSGSVRTGYCFLKTYVTPVKGATPDYATGYSENINIKTNTVVNVVAPNDAHFMVVMAEFENSNRAPQSITADGQIKAIATNLDNAVKQEINISVEDGYFQLSCQADNLINVVGLNSFRKKTMVLVRPDKYSCWPFIGKLRDKLVCLYVKALEHEDSNRGVIWATTSGNGVIWTPKKIAIDTPNKRDGITGKGNDADGNLLFLNRVGNPGGFEHYEVVKTIDGVNFNIISTFGLTINAPSHGGHIGDIINVPNVGLMAFYNTYGSARNWGKIVSTDNGLSWSQTDIETGLSVSNCPVEITAAYLGNGKILAIGRFDDGAGANPHLWQMQSDDYGVTWNRVATNIPGAGNTASIIYDATTGEISLYNYRRQDGILQLRKAELTDIWDNPTNWPSPTNIASGFAAGQDAGNVNAVQFNDIQIAAFYSGTSTDTGIYATIV